jgi:hypothetical protein
MMYRHCTTCKKEYNEYLEGALYSSAAGAVLYSVPRSALKSILTERLKYKIK